MTGKKAFASSLIHHSREKKERRQEEEKRIFCFKTFIIFNEYTTMPTYRLH